MSVAGPVVDRPPVAEPVLPTLAVAAGFEIGMLLRCARTSSGRYGRSAVAPTAVEFSRPAGAIRLVHLLEHLGCAARRDEYVAGGWHRYTVHRVTCPEVDAPVLARAWCAGYQRLCSPEEYRSARQREERSGLAGAAWRAALLAGGLRGRGGPLAVRVVDAELALILVRAARVLDAPVTLRTSGARHLVEVASGPAEAALRELVAASPAGR